MSTKLATARAAYVAALAEALLTKRMIQRAADVATESVVDDVCYQLATSGKAPHRGTDKRMMIESTVEILFDGYGIGESVEDEFADIEGDLAVELEKLLARKLKFTRAVAHYALTKVPKPGAFDNKYRVELIESKSREHAAALRRAEQ